MAKCGFSWAAPKVVPHRNSRGATEHTRIYIPQICSLDKGHDGDHMSNSKVTAPQVKN